MVYSCSHSQVPETNAKDLHPCHILVFQLVNQIYLVNRTSEMIKRGLGLQCKEVARGFQWKWKRREAEGSRTQMVQKKKNRQSPTLHSQAKSQGCPELLRRLCPAQGHPVQVDMSGSSTPLCKPSNGLARTVSAPEGGLFSNWSTQSGRLYL